jgi:hypothetical protein
VAKSLKDLSDLSPDSRNANRGTKRGRELVSRSLADCGAGRSILADAQGQVIAGNKTLEQAKAINMPIKVVETNGNELVVVQRTDLDLNDPQGKARKLAYLDNRTSELDLSWDMSKLKEDFEILAQVGFGENEFSAFLRRSLDERMKKKPEPSADCFVKTGDVFTLGNHRLICGDSTSAEDLDVLFDGVDRNIVDAVVLDPPFELQAKLDIPFDCNSRARFIFSNAKRFGETIAVHGAPTFPFVWDTGQTNMISSTVPLQRAKFCMFYGEMKWENVELAKQALDTELSVKEFEERFHGEGVRPADLYKEQFTKVVKVFAYAKPVNWLRFIYANCARLNCFFVPFCGSGNDLVALSYLKKPAFAVEKDPSVVELAINNWQEHFPDVEVKKS